MKKQIIEKKSTTTTKKILNQLEKEYAKLDKKTCPEGRRIRRKFRRLGKYLSKENIDKTNSKA